MEVALGANGEVEHAVPRELVEHVVEERNAGRKLGAAAAVEIDLDLDLRFGRIAVDFGDAGAVHGATLAGCQRLQRGEQLVVLVGRADGDPQTLFEQRMHAVPILDQYTPVVQRGEPSVASGTRISTKLVCVGNTVTPGKSSMPRPVARARRGSTPPDRRGALPLRGARGRRLGQRIEVVRRTHLVEFGDPRRCADRVAQPNAGHADLGNRAQDDADSRTPAAAAGSCVRRTRR